MNVRALTVMAVSTLAIVAVAGCSAEVPSESDDVAVGTTEATLAPESTTIGDCSNLTPAARQRATQLVKYVFGNDAYAPSGSSTACKNLKSALLDLRSWVAEGSVDVSFAGTTWFCESSVPHDIVINQSSDVNRFPNLISKIAANVDACKGNGTLAAFIPNVNGQAFFMDPEPATLTANLASTSGATAAAYYASSGVATTVAYRPSPGSCGSLQGGEPCSVGALSAGATTLQQVRKSGTLCTCR